IMVVVADPCIMLLHFSWRCNPGPAAAIPTGLDKRTLIPRALFWAEAFRIRADSNRLPGSTKGYPDSIASLSDRGGGDPDA
ncbi:MAG: hypothetical protein M8835_12165, partial [marine benthic group bacterium]|nr:hypothetical protein [Gemmatimonadota bacterium]